MTPDKNWKDKNPIGLAIRDEVEGKPRVECPVCHESDFDHVHFQGNFSLPETDYKRCNNCDHQWDHQ